MDELDKELRELNMAVKAYKQEAQDKVENAEAKITICKFKQDEAAEQTKDLQKELAVERRKFRIIEEDLQRQLDKQLRKQQTSKIVCQTYEYQL